MLVFLLPEDEYIQLIRVSGFITQSTYHIIQVFIYNKGYIQRKLNQGWLPATEGDQEILLSKNILINDTYEGDDDITPYKPNRIGFYLLLVICIFYFLLMIIAAVSKSLTPYTKYL